jgi:acyl-coenzyme A synthetase/AMP-(fatty) acid ligase
LHILAADYYDLVRLSTAMETGQITLINCAPSAFYPLVEEVGPEGWQRFNTLRQVCLGGEPINFSRLKGWLTSEVCQTEISNTYGPTECTDISAFYRVCEARQFQDHTVPIGKPIANVQVYVLDEHLEPVPMGVSGELCVAGVGVGLGYVNDPARTAERFVPNPFVKGLEPREAALRLYRTGDLARWLPDGNLEFLGRRDHQVKVRGFRIELGEIEAALKQHPAVREALILSEAMEEDQSARLVAYLVPVRGETLTPNDLRLFLREKLPEYMTPSAWVVLDALPLTANGKIDRQALPKPEQITVRGGESPAAPGTPYEEILLDIWKEVLRRELIGVHDNFFTLGGHSLLATQILSRVHDRFEVDLPVRTVFEAPTIAEMALWIERELVAQVRALSLALKA